MFIVHFSNAAKPIPVRADNIREGASNKITDVTKESLGQTLVRQRTCALPSAVCPGKGCITCREIGAPFLRMLIDLRNSVDLPTFEESLDRFMEIIKPGGELDFASGIYKDDCCLRIFGVQVSNMVPNLIAYGYVGRNVLPASFLLGFAGFKEENRNATIQDFLEVLGDEFSGMFFRICRVVGIFKVPCLTGPLASRRMTLNEYALSTDINTQNAQRVGLATANTLGAFTNSAPLLQRDLVAELRVFNRDEIERCC